MRQIRITCREAGVSLTAALNESAAAVALWDALPLEAPAQTWGAEVYFTVPVERDAEDPRVTVEPGAVGYWPPGRAVCLFFGQQPVSPVDLIGALVDDPDLLAAVRDGHVVRLERRE